MVKFHRMQCRIPQPEWEKLVAYANKDCRTITEVVREFIRKLPDCRGES